MSKWYDFDPTKGSYQKRPPIKKFVLVQLRSNQPFTPDPIVVWYRKDAAGDKQSPYFICLGAVGHGEAYRWCDCLPDDFSCFYPNEHGKEHELKQSSHLRYIKS